jgi:hypothetical protein
MKGILPDSADRPGIQIVDHGDVFAGVMALKTVDITQFDCIDQINLGDLRPPLLI